MIVFHDQDVRRGGDGGRADLAHEIDEDIAPERRLGQEAQHARQLLDLRGELVVFQPGEHHTRRALRGDLPGQFQPVAIARHDRIERDVEHGQLVAAHVVGRRGQRGDAPAEFAQHFGDDGAPARIVVNDEGAQRLRGGFKGRGCHRIFLALHTE